MPKEVNVHNLKLYLPSERIFEFFFALIKDSTKLKSFLCNKEVSNSKENMKNAVLPLPTSFLSETDFSVNKYADFLCSPENSSDILNEISMRNA